MQTRPQLDEEDVARRIENLTPEERAGLEKIQKEWADIQAQNNKPLLEHLSDFTPTEEEREALHYCATCMGAASAFGVVTYGIVGDLFLRKVRGVTRPLPRALFLVPTTIAGAITGLGFTSGLCIDRISQLNTQLGASVRDIHRMRQGGADTRAGPQHNTLPPLSSRRPDALASAEKKESDASV